MRTNLISEQYTLKYKDNLQNVYDSINLVIEDSMQEISKNVEYETYDVNKVTLHFSNEFCGVIEKIEIEGILSRNKKFNEDNCGDSKVKVIVKIERE